MQRLYLDLAITFFFLVALVLISGTEEQLRQKSKTSYTFLVWGMCLLALMSAYTLFFNQLVENKYLGTSAFAIGELIRLLLLITGLVLATSGISKWLPIFKDKTKEPVSFIGEYLFIKRCLRSFSLNSSVSDFLRESLEIISSNLQITLGTVYAVSSVSHTAKLTASIGGMTSLGNISEQFVVNHSWLAQLSETKIIPCTVSFAELHPGAAGKCFSFLIRTSAQVAFLYLIWSKDRSRVERFDSDILSAVANCLKQRLTNRQLKLSHDFSRMCNEAAHAIRTEVQTGRSIGEQILSAKAILQKRMTVDFLSLCLINHNSTIRRISLGPSDTVLNEVGLKTRSDNSYLYHISQGNKVLSISDVTLKKSFDFSDLESLVSLNSVLAIPLRGTGGARGVLTLGANDAGSYGNVEKRIVLAAQSAFELMLNEMIVEEESAAQSYREVILSSFAKDILACDSPSNLYKLAGTVIRKALGFPIIRISSVDVGAKFLTSQLLLNDTKSKARTPENARLLLSLLHWHEAAFESGNTVTVICNDQKNGMSDVELMQVFSPGIKRATIVPIRNFGKVVGLISLADDKVLESSALTESNISFVEAIAALLALGISALQQVKNAPSEFSSKLHSVIVEAGQRRNIRSQLRSSLTGILGSLEMIRRRDAGDGVNRDKFLNIIDKSARKMSDYLTE